MATREVTTVHATEVESAILEAARDLLAEKGLQGLSMRQVADLVGVSATAIYHYFENKDELVRRVVQLGFHQFGEYLKEAAETHPRGSLERVRALGEAYLQFALENQTYFRVLFSIQHPAPASLDELPEGGGYGLLRQAVVDAVSAGTMREADPDVVVMYLWSIAHGLLTLTMACDLERCPEFGPGSRRRTPVELFRAFELLVRDGIAAPAGERASQGDRIVLQGD
ncbi:MAG: TetR family transcriptional regulator [Gemmatimonadales bacterium]|nr:TetR family transcriptional regulator [Gemmatimonadales bacterium]NIN13344.1 TetR family transcriptional regulator [Gemmatimonadales bacterium]NIN51347.1 TetR family transcriptional regulator [Gemmatimonadales bacterium]NIP08811.1 TetR family transcriptional regulator [Gemmatimonadales bacterium]NIQ99805.1 TetR family transcriptional regulator [Gemmatimonadales bacterium]